MTPFQVFIGYDSREPTAYHVCAHSILRRASIPVSITPLVRSGLPMYRRERSATESTEFSLTRFLVPHLCGYKGWALFMDSDMLMRVDIADLIRAADRQRDKAVIVCQHDYDPQGEVKFLGHIQTRYPRKNWSSFMLFRNDLCEALTPHYVNTATGLELHRFTWLVDEAVGSLPLDWNWLVGEYPPNPEAKVWHYTLGGPWFEETAQCDHADAWREEYAHMVRCATREIAHVRG
jgi:hypothetical protein